MNADGCCGIMACAKLSDTADHLDDDKNEGDQFELDYREMNRTVSRSPKPKMAVHSIGDCGIFIFESSSNGAIVKDKRPSSLLLI